MGDPRDKVKAFLKTIQKIESSNGKDFSHPTMQSGIHKGESAMGRYGLMPNTVSEVLTRLRRAGRITPELEKLQEIDAGQLKNIIESNPQLEDHIAEELAQRVLSRQPSDDMAAYSWNKGHNLSPERIKQVPYEESDYVKKYKMYKGEENE